jgi:hypothetical protein
MSVMNILRLTVLLPVLVLLMSACASLSEDECRYADWQTIGFQDGSRGYPADRIGSHRKACAEHGVMPDMAAYQQGRDQGLVHYCTAANGVKTGRSGHSYRGVCPAELQADFQIGYSLGRQINALRVDMGKHQVRVHNLDKLLDSDELDDEERERLRYEIRQLEREYGRMEVNLENLESEAIQIAAYY